MLIYYGAYHWSILFDPDDNKKLLVYNTVCNSLSILLLSFSGVAIWLFSMNYWFISFQLIQMARGSKWLQNKKWIFLLNSIQVTGILI